MTRAVAGLLAAGALVGPSTALAATPTIALIPGHHHARNVARQQCATERKLLGVKAFRLKYGTPNAYAKCVRSHLPGDRQAAVACRAERKQTGAAAFRRKYGGPSPLNRCIKEQTNP